MDFSPWDKGVRTEDLYRPHDPNSTAFESGEEPTDWQIRPGDPEYVEVEDE